MPSRIIPVLDTGRLTLTLPAPSANERVQAFYQRNSAYFAPTDPPRPAAFLTAEYWARRLELNLREFREDAALRLFAFHRDGIDGPVVGSCNFTNFIRGPFQACTLGFALDREHVGTGMMAEALTAAIRYVFTDLGMHRIMAAHLPTNERSGRLLRRLGFVVEGFARDYLFINGQWRDHVLTALTNPQPTDPP